MGVEMTSTGKSGRSASGSAPAAPPPPPPSCSVTRREIDKFWRKRRSVEEEHFVAAIKAAARLRASRLSEEDYLMFLEENKIEEEGGHTHGKDANDESNENDKAQEIRVGIKDWWTKSKYAYLNEPAVGSRGGTLGRGSRSRRWNNYIPNKVCLCNYSYAEAAAAKDDALPLPLPVPPYLGVF